jgi:hypothetical protein
MASMTYNNGISLANSALITVLSLLLIRGFFLIITVSYGSEQTLVAKEAIENLQFTIYNVMAIILVVALLIQILKNHRYAALGIALSSFINLYYLYQSGLTYMKNTNYYEKYDRAKWFDYSTRSMNMAKTMCYDNSLLNLTAEEIKEKIGDVTSREKIEPGVYAIRDSWYFKIEFQNGKSISCEIYEPNFFYYI